MKNRTRSTLVGGQTLLVCLSEYTVTDHESNLAVNKFHACTNLVKFIFKSFVGCNLLVINRVRVLGSLLGSKRHGLQIYIEKSIFQKVETARLLAL